MANRNTNADMCPGQTRAIRATRKSDLRRYFGALTVNTKPDSTKNSGTAPASMNGRKALAGKKYPVCECHSTIENAAKKRRPVSAG